MLNNEKAKNTIELTGGIGALIGEYRKAIDELILVLKPINDQQLIKIVDPNSLSSDSKSIQTILTHVIKAGYTYIVYIENHIGIVKPLPEKVLQNQVDIYIDQLNQMFDYSLKFFQNNTHLEIEQTDNSKKINVNWGQQYDIEQLLEHAIVHILRHRRQIEKYLILQKPGS